MYIRGELNVDRYYRSLYEITTCIKSFITCTYRKYHEKLLQHYLSLNSSMINFCYFLARLNHLILRRFLPKNNVCYSLFLYHHISSTIQPHKWYFFCREWDERNYWQRYYIILLEGTIFDNILYIIFQIVKVVINKHYFLTYD